MIGGLIRSGAALYESSGLLQTNSMFIGILALHAQNNPTTSLSSCCELMTDARSRLVPSGITPGVRRPALSHLHDTEDQVFGFLRRHMQGGEPRPPAGVVRAASSPSPQDGPRLRHDLSRPR